MEHRSGQRRGLRRGTARLCATLVGALLVLPSCAPPRFPVELFSITCDGADYPVMLSETPRGQRGHQIEASSGTRATVSSSTYSSGRSSVTVTQTSASASELSASIKLGAQVQRADKWLQLDGVEFHSEDFATYGAASAERQLTIHGTAYR